MKCIIVLGLPLSGKTTHAKAVEDMEIPLVETGTFVYEAVKERGLEAVPENVVKVASELKSNSDSYFTEKAYVYARENYSSYPAVFFSGIKAQSEVDFLRKEAGHKNVYLISFHASVDTRHGRLMNVDRKTESKGEKAQEDIAMTEDRSRFDLRDEKELGYGLGKLMSLADYIVNTEDKLWPYNNFDKTLEDFKIILSDIIKN